MTRRRTLVVVTLCSVVGAGGGAALVALSPRPQDTTSLRDALRREMPTVQVREGRIVAHETYSGKIIRSRGRALTVKGAAEGAIVTSVAVTRGQLIGPGAVVATVQGSPVVVLRGALPSYRSIRPGMSGPDVDQLHRAMSEQLMLPCACGRKVTNREIAVLRRHVFRSAAEALDAQAWNGEVPVDGVVWMPVLPVEMGSVRWRAGGEASRVIAYTQSSRRRMDFEEMPAASRAVRGNRVVVRDRDGRAWKTRLAAVSAANEGQLKATLAGVPPDALRSPIEASIRTIFKPGRALIVPASAVGVSADNREIVAARRGRSIVRLRVRVVAELDGQLAIRGDGLRPVEDIVLGQPRE